MLSKNIINQFNDIDETVLIKILFEMNRYYDKELKEYFKNYKEETGITLDTFKRKALRSYYYYGNERILKDLDIKFFPSIKKNAIDIKNIDKLTQEKLMLPTKDKIIKSINSRYQQINLERLEADKADKWIRRYKEKYKNNSDFVIYNITQEIIDDKCYLSNIFNHINYSYNKLNNYRYLSIVMEDKIYENGYDISWNILSKVAIYMENFLQEEEPFFAFKKQQKIDEMITFISSNKNINKHNFKNEVEKFYNNISKGFVFSDLLVSNNQSKKVLIMKKILLDEEPVPCPACLCTNNRGNSYPMMFLKSWECQNPECPERSKSGRGKRFDEYGIYRYFKLVENNDKNIISKELYNNWRRDIFNNELDIYEMLIMYYSWDCERILVINGEKKQQNFGRIIEHLNINEIKTHEKILYDKLPIYKLLSSISNYAKTDFKKIVLSENCEIFNGDSTEMINGIEPHEIAAVITSPPYYNAREYSQWPSLILYLIDMMLNAKAIYSKLYDNGTYLYNVGDIVGKDNVYVSSNMSNRRIMLGFYSAMIFDIVGFNLVGNMIWDKGEVQSKRNSTVNLISGYVKYVNCYEHILVFKKNRIQESGDNEVYKIKPVYKINSKGQNILGHTAPYPEEVVELIRKYVKKEKYILDPYLGSGTTGIWAQKNKFKFVGFELNKNYYNLCIDRIKMNKKRLL